MGDSPEPAWLRALMRLKPALDTIKAVNLCAELTKIESKIRDETFDALFASDYKRAHGLTNELSELIRFKEIVCKK